MPYKGSGAANAEDNVYNEFSRYKAGDCRIIIATFDGEAELFSVADGINPMDAIKSVCRMFRNDFDRFPENIMAYDYEGYPAKGLKPSEFV